MLVVGPARPPPCAHCGRLRKSGGVIGGSYGLCSRDSFIKLGLEGGGRERGLRRNKKSKGCVNGFFVLFFYLCVRTGAQVRG